MINLTYNEGITILVQIVTFAILYFAYNMFIDKKNMLIVIYLILSVSLWLYVINITYSATTFLSFDLPIRKCNI